jgi:hypothetical protein
MTFCAREEARQIQLKQSLFSASACRSDIWLSESCLSEALHKSFRDEAIEYFERRRIPWHSLGHLLCSQSCCVNFWFGYFRRPELLANVLREIGYPVHEMLAFELDSLDRLADMGFDVDYGPLLEREKPAPHYIAFEWIGAKNYLGELRAGKPASDSSRTRGQHFTSTDVAFRFVREDGRQQIVLGEWKYTEAYPVGADKRVSDAGTDRLNRIYRRPLEQDGCQLQLGAVKPESLFFDPFDQMMRHQLLSSEMESAHEMGADIVSYLHIAPRCNGELMQRITSPALAHLGKNVHEVWAKLVKPAEPSRFHLVYTEDLLKVMNAHAPSDSWKRFVNARYGGMQ